MTVAELLDLVTQGGVIGLLLLFVVALWRRWLVWRGEYEALHDDRNFWRTMALNATGLAEITAKRRAGTDDDG